jgi:GntR family transcriptional regulator
LEHDYAHQPLREVLESNYGIRIASAKQVIQAIQAPPELARLLNISPGNALLLITRVSFSQGNLPVEYLRIHYRADRYSLYNELHE